MGAPGAAVGLLRPARVIVGGALVTWTMAALGPAPLVLAYPQFEEAARPMGARGCTYCHATAHGTGWNKRGQWLIREKTERETERVEVEWLSEYRPPKPTRRWSRRSSSKPKQTRAADSKPPASEGKRPAAPAPSSAAGQKSRAANERPGEETRSDSDTGEGAAHDAAAPSNAGP